ncbi:hypothetical protein [Foetidibacter luteolus]|uniref:hypothetical protein n=1 Tax=Foetidibacter luteolus TaxID=2608880 RepID=UPI00129A1D74|nr:hypothetical protein [Foetidibacter luteolus]
MMHQSRNILLCLLVACCSMGKAQQFGKKAALQPVTATGFYAIDINPQLSSFSTLDFADLRIADEQGQYQPYIIRSHVEHFFSRQSQPLPIISNTVTDSGKTVLIVENSQQQKLKEVTLVIRNAVVSRTANISGSDNRQSWFAIAENVNLESRFSDSADRYVQQFQFPLSSYRYFKIEINNGKNDALSIISAGHFTAVEGNQQAAMYVSNPACDFIQKDSNNISCINVTQSASFHTDRIVLYVKGPKFFKRAVDIQAGGMLHSFFISADTVFNFYPSSFKQRYFVIRIYNGDNPPLTVTRVATQQQHKQVVTYLEATKNYHLLLSDSLAVKPDYDLQQFADSIPADIKTLGFESIVDNNPPAAGLPSASAWKKWLWPILIAVLAVLAMFTLRLLKDVQKKQ